MLVSIVLFLIIVVNAGSNEQNPVLPFNQKPTKPYFTQNAPLHQLQQPKYQGELQNQQPSFSYPSSHLQPQPLKSQQFQNPQQGEHFEVQPPTKSDNPDMHNLLKSVHLMQNKAQVPHLKYDKNENPLLSFGNQGLDKNYGDRAARREEFPFNIQIRHNGQFTCSGTLVRSPITGKHVVLTATHCLVEKGTSKLQPPSSYGVHAGILYHDEQGQMRRVKQVLVHPGYTICFKTNRPIFDDIGIMYLDRDFEENLYVRPLEFPRIPGPTLWDYVDIQGWGKGREAGHTNISSVLRVLKLKVWDNQDCDKVYFEESGEHIITEEHFCAGTKEGGKDACQGDSGSTVVAIDKGLNYFAGIVSWGKGNCKGFKYLVLLVSWHFI